MIEEILPNHNVVINKRLELGLSVNQSNKAEKLFIEFMKLTGKELDYIDFLSKLIGKK